MTDWVDIPDYEVKSLTRKSFDDIIYRNEEQSEYEWFEARVKIKVDVDKDESYLYLIADENLKKANGQLIHYLQDSQGTFKIVSIKERGVSDVVLRKECCKVDECDVCEFNYKVISFDEQRSIDVDLGKIERARAELMEELGAISLSLGKFTINATKENLERVKDKVLAGRVLRSWKEDFIDEGSGDVIQIDRNEVVAERGSVIDDDIIEIIINSGQKTVKIYR